MEFQRVGSHDDVVNDIAFDFYGKRFATCSSDKNIRVWDLKDAGQESSGERYSCSEIPRAHQSAIWRLSWAHPEFGQLLASCSEDRTTCIWEEQESIGGEYILKNRSANNSKQPGQRWQVKTSLGIPALRPAPLEGAAAKEERRMVLWLARRRRGMSLVAVKVLSIDECLPVCPAIGLQMLFQSLEQLPCPA